MRGLILLLDILLAPTMMGGGFDMNLNRVHQLFLLTATVAMEAEGESYKGKLAVAYVILNRSSAYDQTIDQVLLKPYAFSAWNTRGRKHRLEEIPTQAWFDSERAATSAFYGTEKDPSLGATHYLNEPLTRSMRKGGDLPRWVSRLHKLVDIGEHSFYVETKAGNHGVLSGLLRVAGTYPCVLRGNRLRIFLPNPARSQPAESQGFNATHPITSPCESAHGCMKKP